ncbi:MAG: OmpA family protein [Candidatus Kapabacteria bacterium]|nr:OmpA family protein [Ignavibacteriota bacterium]MCW5884776.1 OmpA family protein [Candidatus Kapabacteria bacterium]
MESVDWMLDEDKRSIPVLDKPLEFTLTAYDIKSNKAVSDKGIIEIEQITVQKKRTSGVADKQIDNYSLILFDFDKSDISFNNKEIIGFVKSRLNADSKVEITGYTDRTGDDTYNKRLSERRASTVNGELKHKGSTFKGIGKEILLYDNDFPEGRFYCRTVNIRVENEIK